MPKSEQSIWQRSTIGRVFRFVFSERVMRLTLKILLVGAVVLALYYGEEDWRGSRAWKIYLSHSGITPDQLDLQTFIPKHVPNDENFAAIPVIKRWFVIKSENDPFNSDHFSKAPPLLIETIKNVENKKGMHRLDLTAWKNGLIKKSTTGFPSMPNGETPPSSRQEAAAAVLATLQDDDAAILSLRMASVRSKFFYPVNYTLDDPWNILLPHDYNIKELAVRLELRACAELAEGDSDKAFDDVMLTLYLADSLTNEAMVISYLVRAGCVHAAVQPIWEGIAEQRWSDSQLQAIEMRLLQFNFTREIEKPLKTERAVGVLTIDLTKSKGVGYLARAATTKPTIFGGVIGKAIDCAIPSGWFALEKVNYCRLFDTLFTRTFDPIAGTVSPLQADANRETFNRDANAGGGTPTGIILHHRTVARLFLPTLPKVLFRGAIAQTAANQAALACALERYHLAHGKYPATLPSLVPEWMPTTPRDVIGGHAYRYRRIDADRFVLYSIGWDGKDDGGTAGESLFGRQGDWLWKNSD
jgi:hypothetical protein